MFAYMPDGFLNAVNNLDGENIIEKFSVEIGASGFFPAYYGVLLRQ